MMADLKSAQLDALVLKSLLGEDVVDIKFHLFSSRSKRKRRVFRPRALHANSKLLSENSTFLADCEFYVTEGLDFRLNIT